MNVHDQTEKMAEALEKVARAFTEHSGPGSSARERSVFGKDLRVAAIRFARAYYAEARELGLIPEYERTQNDGKHGYLRRNPTNQPVVSVDDPDAHVGTRSEDPDMHGSMAWLRRESKETP